MSKCDKVKLSELINQKTDTEQIVDMENEHYITLSLYGKGARERVIKDGKYPVPFTGYRVSEGQFIYSRIDARNGAYDIIGPELDGFVVSKDFPVFDINESKVLPHFLRRAVLSDAFINQVKNSSFGATNRMRIKEDIFADYSIPLPELSKQKEIVDILDRVETIIDSRQQELQKLDDLIKARFVEMFIAKDFPILTLDEVSLSKGEYGAQSASIRYDPSRPRYVRITDINDDGTLNNDVVSSANKEDDEQYKLTYGDFMFARMGATVGKTYAYKSGNQIFAGYLIRYKLDLGKIMPEYLYAYTKLDEYENWVLLNQSGAAQPGINAKKYGSLKIPVPPIEVQRQFVGFCTKIDKSKLLEARQAGFIAKTGRQISFCR